LHNNKSKVYTRLTGSLLFSQDGLSGFSFFKGFSRSTK
jgi:hypothetical protein